MNEKNEKELRAYVLQDVPDEDANSVVSDFEAEGAIAITKTKQDNGLWTIEANFDSSQYK